MTAPVTPSARLLERARAAGGRGMVGYIGEDVPLEILDAAGLTPVRILADPGAPSPSADAYAEGRGHPLIHANLAELMDLADAGVTQAIIGATPVSNIALHNFLLSLERLSTPSRVASYLFDLLHADADSTVRYDEEGLRRLAAHLAPGLTPDVLQTAIRDRNAVRNRLRALEGHRHGPTPRLSGVEALTMHAEAASLPARDALRQLDRILAEVGERPILSGKPVVMSGGAASALRTYRVLEAVGLRVVGDDHEAGSRSIGPQAAEDGDPFVALGQRYRHRAPSPAGWSTRDATAYLLRLIEQTGAQAVVFDIPAYDHPAAWDYPVKRDALQAVGVPSVLMAPYAYLDPENAAAEAAQSLVGDLASKETPRG